MRNTIYIKYIKNSLNNNKRKSETHIFQNILRGVCIALVLLSPFVSSANAQEATCIPYAYGVPALSGPPNWWDTTKQPPYYNNRTDDPRWMGAASQTFGGGADQEASFRALYDSQNSLYLSWIANVVPNINNKDNHALYVGFSPGGGAQEIIIKITPFGSAANSLNGDPFFSNETYKYNVATKKWESSNNPAWIGSFTRAWLKNAYPYSWAVQMKVPKSSVPNSGLNFGNTFRLWYEIQVDTGSGTISYNWPRNVNITFNETTFQYDLPDPSTWGEFRLGSGGSACGIGVSIARDGIGTFNTYIDGSPAYNTINASGTNTFFAKPFNNMTTAIPVGGIKARFRIANWGSQPDWNNVSDTSLLWNDIRNGNAVSNNNPIPSGSSGNITFSWTLDAAEKADFQPSAGGAPPKKRTHQCMLVELSGPNITFINNSVYRNMDFDHVSDFNRDAEISIKGLPSMQSGKYDVYLYEIIKNMPSVVEQRPLPPSRTIWNEGSESPLPFTWDSSNFEELQSDSLKIVQEDLGAAKGKTRIIRSEGLSYNKSKQLREFAVSKAFDGKKMVKGALNEDGYPSQYGNYYAKIDLFGEPYVALNGEANKLSKLVLEQSHEEKKYLEVGQTWDIGDGYSLTAQAIDARTSPRQAWIILKKDGIQLDEGIITSGNVYTYVDKDYGPMFATYVGNIFSGATSDMAQLSYTWAISRNILKIPSVREGPGVPIKDSIFGITSATKDYVSMENYKEINLLPNKIILLTTLSSDRILPLAKTLSFRVIDDDNSLKFYPVISRAKDLEELPTYQIYVYRDTGMRANRQGVSYPILKSQTSFGVFLQPYEEITGWKNSMKGVQEIAPHFYKLEVPNNGTALVNTRIVAIEPRSNVTLVVTATPTTVRVGTPTSVTFTVMTGVDTPVSGATIALSGEATGSGITDESGNVIIKVNPKASGTITATASKNGYISGTATVTAIPPPMPLGIAATPTNVKVGIPTYVTFTVTSNGRAVSGATVALSGKATGSGITDASGNTVINVNAAAAGPIIAVASKSDYTSASTTMTAPGFEVVFTVVGLLAAVYFALRSRK